MEGPDLVLEQEWDICLSETIGHLTINQVKVHLFFGSICI
jgi:hypothetical protein